MVPLYVPAASDPVAALTVIAPLALPEPGETDSQLALSLADHVSVPPPVLLILSVWFAGLLPPCCAVKERLVGLRPIEGGTGAADTVKATGILIEVAPGALTVTIPL
jgi:hypothetical protein